MFTVETTHGRSLFNQVKREYMQKAHAPFSVKGACVINAFGVEVARCIDPEAALFIMESVNAQAKALR